MENEEASSARPSIGFPLGLALLLFMLFSISGFLTCCLHWDKIRSLIQPFRDDNSDDIQTNFDHLRPQMPSPLRMKSKQNQAQSLLVSMPGDEIPKFIAMACPCKPPIVEKVTVTVHKTPA